MNTEQLQAFLTPTTVPVPTQEPARHRGAVQRPELVLPAVHAAVIGASFAAAVVVAVLAVLGVSPW